MVKADYLKSFSDKERQIIEILSRVVDIVKEIYLKQKNQACPAGNLYPPGITREEFDQAAIRDPALKRFDTVVERMTASRLCAVPYNEKYQAEYDRIQNLLHQAADLADHRAFKRYLNSLIICLRDGGPSDYWQMMAEWVRTKRYRINFPFTYDELYMDRLVGVKGGFNAGVFLEDAEASPPVQQLLGTVEAFKRTVDFPARPKTFPDLFLAVYRTVNHQGMMAEMGLRAWNLPNDLALREKVGARQTIIRESVETEFIQQAYPLVQEIMPTMITGLNRSDLLHGLFAAYALHEISHNIGRYEKEAALEKYFSAFEELEACLIPILWADFLVKRKVYNAKQKAAAVIMLLAANFIDIITAETVQARESYRQAALVQLNYLNQAGVVTGLATGQFCFSFDKLQSASREFLASVVSLSARGNFEHAKKYVAQYGSSQAIQPVITRIKKIIK